MQKEFLLICLLIFCVSCQQQKEVNYAILSGNIKNAEIDSVFLRVDSYDKFYNQREMECSMALVENRFADTLFLSKGIYELDFGTGKIKLFLKPGTNLNFRIEGQNVVIEGEGEVENNYLLKRTELNQKIAGLNFYSHYSRLNESGFLKLADSIEKLRLNLLNHYPDIDEEFRFVERESAKIDRAHKIIKYPFVRRLFVESDYQRSQNYPSNLLKGIDLNDKKLLDVPFYPLLVTLYANSKSKMEGEQKESWQYILSDDFILTSSELKEVVLYTDAMSSMEKYGDPDLFYDSYMKFAENEELKEKISHKYVEIKSLTKGDSSPEFELRDIEGNLFSSRDLKGNVVYIDVWAVWCKPCIKEMPRLKALQEEFDHEDVKFISVGIESDKEQVVAIIERYSLSGIHLFDPEQEKDFTIKFFVTALPRYILIDKKGRIADFSARKPSDIKLKEEIKRLL